MEADSIKEIGNKRKNDISNDLLDEKYGYHSYEPSLSNQWRLENVSKNFFYSINKLFAN